MEIAFAVSSSPGSCDHDDLVEEHGAGASPRRGRELADGDAAGAPGCDCARCGAGSERGRQIASGWVRIAMYYRTARIPVATGDPPGARDRSLTCRDKEDPCAGVMAPRRAPLQADRQVGRPPGTARGDRALSVSLRNRGATVARAGSAPRDDAIGAARALDAARRCWKRHGEPGGRNHQDRRARCVPRRAMTT